MKAVSITDWCIIAAEATVAYAVLGLFLGPTGVDNARSALVAPASLVASFVLQRLLTWFGIHVIARRVIAIVSGVAAALLALKVSLFAEYGLVDPTWMMSPWHDLMSILTSFPFALFLLLATAIVWGRGSLLGAGTFTFHTAAISFQVGITALLTTHCIAALKAITVPHALLVTVTFFSFSLLGVALAHRQHIGRGVGVQSRQWLLLLLASVLLASALGGLVGAYFDGRVIQLMLALIKLLGDLLGALLNFLAQLIPPSPPTDVPSITPIAPPSAKQVHEGPLLEIPKELLEVLRWLWAAIIIGFTIIAILRIISDIVLHLFRMATTVNGTVETVPDGWRNDLRAVLRAFARAIRALADYVQWLFHRWRRRPVAASSPVVGAVRETYRDLLYWAAKRGLPREAKETPYEYLQRLCIALPAGAADLSVLTDSYVLARYCPNLLQEEERRAAEHAWHRLRRLRRS